jgi:hypothetical protein
MGNREGPTPLRNFGIRRDQRVVIDLQHGHIVCLEEYAPGPFVANNVREFAKDVVRCEFRLRNVRSGQLFLLIRMKHAGRLRQVIADRLRHLVCPTDENESVKAEKKIVQPFLRYLHFAKLLEMTPMNFAPEHAVFGCLS